MTEVQVVATLKAKPGRREALLVMCRSLLEPTRAEPGCVRYELFEDAQDPDVIVFVERWASAAALATHLAAPHVRAGMAQLPELTLGGVDLRRLRPVG